jgi:hypothetical protein
MKTAEEIYESNVEYERCEIGERVKRSILSAIITAQKEAIEECAEKAQIKWIDDEYDEERRDMICHPEINKESILNLINELK